MRAAEEGQDELRGDGGGAYEGGCGEEQRAHFREVFRGGALGNA